MDAISWKFTGKPWNLNSYPLTPDEVWAKLDLPPEEVRTKLNAVITLFNSVVDGASGADNVAMTPITAIGTQATVQAIVEALVTRIQSVVVDTSGAKFIGVETIAGLTGNDVRTLLIALKTLADGYDTYQTSALGTHKTSSDHNGQYYTKTDLNAGQLDSRYYTETESNARYATSTDVQNVVLGQIPNRTLDPVKDERLNLYRSNKDSNGVWQTLDYKRTNGTLAVHIQLSGGIAPSYTTRTFTYYASDGTTVLFTDVETITYDSYGDPQSEVV